MAAEGRDAILFNCASNPSQKWQLDSDGYFRHTPDPTLCVVPKAPGGLGAEMEIGNCALSGPQFQFLPDGTIRLLSDATLCLASSTPANGQGFKMELATCSAPPDDTQVWYGS